MKGWGSKLKAHCKYVCLPKSSAKYRNYVYANTVLFMALLFILQSWMGLMKMRMSYSILRKVGYNVLFLKLQKIFSVKQQILKGLSQCFGTDWCNSWLLHLLALYSHHFIISAVACEFHLGSHRGFYICFLLLDQWDFEGLWINYVLWQIWTL